MTHKILKEEKAISSGKKILLKNISLKRFGVSLKRTLHPNSTLEFSEEEAKELLKWEGDIIQVGENGSNISTETITSLQSELERVKAENEALRKAAGAEDLETKKENNDLRALKEEAKSLGIDIKGNPSIETLKIKIEEARMMPENPTVA